MSANQYAEKHVRIVKAMKKVDPTIKVTSAGATPAELSMMTQENKQFIPNFWWPSFTNDLPYKFESNNDYDYWMLNMESVGPAKASGIREAIQWLRKRGMPILADKMEREMLTTSAGTIPGASTNLNHDSTLLARLKVIKLHATSHQCRPT